MVHFIQLNPFKVQNNLLKKIHHLPLNLFSWSLDDEEPWKKMDEHSPHPRWHRVSLEWFSEVEWGPFNFFVNKLRQRSAKVPQSYLLEQGKYEKSGINQT